MATDFVELGTSKYQAGHPVCLSHAARLRHLFVIGQTGAGKTTVLQRLAAADLHAGNGFLFLDPHGDAAAELIEYIPPHRMDDVIYLRPADTDRTFGFNLLENVPDAHKDRLTQEVVATFRYRWSDSWGPRMESIFKHTVRALLDVPDRAGGATLLMVPVFLTRADFRRWVLQWSGKPAVRDFFRFQFDRWNERQQAEYVQPILNKVDQFLLSDTVRQVVGQARSTIDLDYLMNHRRVLIVNLDKGAIGSDDADLIGSLLVTGCHLAAMRRSVLPPAQRVPFYAYLDEFSSFATGSFRSILSESRKYRFGLTIAAQYLEQIEHQQIRAAVFGNCGNICSFRVSHEDANQLAPTLGHQAGELEHLATGEAVVKYLRGQQPHTTVVQTDQLDPAHYVGRSKRVKRAARRYTTPIELITERHTGFAHRLTGPFRSASRHRGRNHRAA